MPAGIGSSSSSVSVSEPEASFAMDGCIGSASESDSVLESSSFALAGGEHKNYIVNEDMAYRIDVAQQARLLRLTLIIVLEWKNETDKWIGEPSVEPS